MDLEKIRKMNDEEYFRYLEIIEEVEDKECEYIEELTYENTFKDNSDMEVQEILVNKINALIRNQKYILEQLKNEK